MKPILALSFAVLAVPVLLAAQSPAPAPAAGTGTATVFMSNLDGAKTTTIVTTIPGSSCPVAMQAKQGSSSGLVMVRKNHPDDGESMLTSKPGQRIHLILGKMSGGQFSDLQQIASATVTAKGLSARDRLSPAIDLSGDRHSDMRRTLNVAFATEKDGSISAELILPGFTSVNSIRLESVDLKDGSTWTLPDLKACVVTPDPMMLVASQ
jgi:hypothetical protein